jgi:hypothetical protein
VPGPPAAQDPEGTGPDQRDASDHGDDDAFDVQLDTTIYQAALGAAVTLVARGFAPRA